ncbi:MAG: hypothetical protein U0271_19105 [Polyangiaceae bacterium]
MGRGISGWVGAAVVVLSASTASAGDRVEAGAGWQNMGALEGTLEWTASIQGSRKDVPAFIGWRHVDDTRVYYSPFIRLDYTNFWSLAGGGNLLGVTLAPVGIGVYLTDPPAEVSKGGLVGRWFVALDINLAALQAGGNITPDSPEDERVKDPEAYRSSLLKEKAETGGLAGQDLPQRYPFGDYSFFRLGFPVHVEAFNLVKPDLGVGFFVESYVAAFEVGLNVPYAASSFAYGYSVMAGGSVVIR